MKTTPPLLIYSLSSGAL